MCIVEHVCIVTYMYMSMEPQSLCQVSSFIILYSVEGVSLEEARTCGIVSLACFLCRCRKYASQKPKLQAWLPGFSICCENLDPGTHSFIANNLSTEMFLLLHMWFLNLRTAD